MAAKLDQVPVPDMSHSIWAGIETQLDAGVQVDTPKGKGWWYGFIGIVTVVTLILIGWYYSHKSNAPEKTVPKESGPVTKAPLPASDSNTIINKPKRKQLPVAPPPGKKDTLLNNNIIVDSTFRQDPPPARQDITPPVRVDSSINIPPAVKKHRGVRGITDDDYKISAKKDSAGKRD